MMTVIIFGVYFDAAFREVKVRTVPCSVTIEDMARKLNVTLLDKCVVVE
jgi:signal recognition particle subunit SEC65